MARKKNNEKTKIYIYEGKTEQVLCKIYIFLPSDYMILYYMILYDGSLGTSSFESPPRVPFFNVYKRVYIGR